MLQKKILRKFTILYASITLILSSMLYNSCTFLDIDPYITDLFTLDSVFAKQEYAEKYLYNLYSYIVDNGSYRGNPGRNNLTMPWTPISDECVSGYKRMNYHSYAVWSNNELTPENFYGFDNRYNKFYEGIRRANTFLIKIDENKEAGPNQKADWTGEATTVNYTHLPLPTKAEV